MQSDLDFLRQSGWANSARYDFPADWSTRRFARLTNDNNQSAILMSSVPDTDPRALAGHKIRDFIVLSEFLRGCNVRAPIVYNADEQNGFLLVEDFGDYSLHHAFIEHDDQLLDYYLRAADILKTLRDTGVGAVPQSTPHYFDTHVFKGRCRLWDWYLPTVYKQSMVDFKNESLKILIEIEQSIPQSDTVFLHGDFHPHNLMILPDGGIGMLDFQGGMIGPSAYDSVNLLRDARRRVPASIYQAVEAHMMHGLSSEQRALYQAQYALRSFDFHARVLGQAIKLALNGKDKLLAFIPLLEEYCLQDLAHPLLQPLNTLFTQHKIDLNRRFELADMQQATDFIASDAF